MWLKRIRTQTSSKQKMKQHQALGLTQEKALCLLMTLRAINRPWYTNEIHKKSILSQTCKTRLLAIRIASSTGKRFEAVVWKLQVIIIHTQLAGYLQVQSLQAHLKCSHTTTTSPSLGSPLWSITWTWALLKGTQTATTARTSHTLRAHKSKAHLETSRTSTLTAAISTARQLQTLICCRIIIQGSFRETPWQETRQDAMDTPKTIPRCSLK